MVILGTYRQQAGGYNAFIPHRFPPEGLVFNDPQLLRLLSEADQAIGRLDGITRLLPDMDMFLYMYVKKEAASSSQIEGTRANLTDALEAEVDRTRKLPDDVDDILHYIEAIHKGLDLFSSIPLSLRLIREVHRVLMMGGRHTAFPYPGEFRKTQNWIMGVSVNDARFIPPPPEFITSAVGDIEQYIHGYSDIPSLIKTGLIHAQFETIHPFTDGNGRTGRLLMTFYLYTQKILAKPVLYFSSYFKKHRDAYFEALDRYHEGKIVEWLRFFLQGITEIAKEAIMTTDAIVSLRERDLQKISVLGKSTKHAVNVLKHLYALPIVNVAKVEEWTNLSRVSANRLVSKLVQMGLLTQKDKRKKYGRLFVYKEYLSLFD